jgi:hypothetical protein
VVDGEQDLRALLESTGGGSAAFGVMSVVAEKKERTFATLNEVLEQGGVNDLKKFIKARHLLRSSCASRTRTTARHTRTRTPLTNFVRVGAATQRGGQAGG